jgi:hypothetical protein
MFLVVAITLVPQVGRASAATTDQLTSTEVQITSDQTWVAALTTDTEKYTCSGGYPHLVNWKDNSSGGGTYSEWSSGGSGTSDDPDWVKVLFGGGFLTTSHSGVNAGILYLCSSQWYPTTADCGTEGQPDCWGAVQGYAPGTPKQGWMRADFMFDVNETGLCDHGLYGGTDYACQASTRHHLDDEGHGGTWETWALDQQANNLAANEPMNWIVQPRTHESYNDEADAYAIPNHVYSLSDQLDAGTRSLDLRPRWGAGADDYLRLSHGDNDCGGCSGLDRPYTYAIAEIAKWLNDNPDQVIFLDLEQYNGGNGRHAYLIDPIEKYMGNKVLSPHQWCTYLATESHTNGAPTPDCSDIPNNAAGGAWQPYRWPTIAEMKSMGKRIIITDRQILAGWDSDVTFGATLDTDQNAAGDELYDPFARSFNAATCSRGSRQYNIATLGKAAFYQSWTTVAEARVFGEAQFAFSTWPGYIYAYHGDVPVVDDLPPLTGNIDPRPLASHGTSVEDLVNCNIVPSLDMFRADINFNGIGNPVISAATQHDRRDPMIWTWSKGDYGQPHTCALLQDSDDHFHSAPCDSTYHVACGIETRLGSGQFRVGDPYSWQDPMGVDWRVTSQTYSWHDAAQGCANEFPGYVFAVPKNKWQENQLQSHNTAHADLWLSYTDNTSDGQWRVAAPPVVRSAQPFYVAPGASVALSADAISPTGTAITGFKWDLNNSGTFHDLGTSPTFSAPTDMAPGVQTIEVKAVDQNGLESPAFPAYVYVSPTGARVAHFASGTSTDALSDAVATIAPSTASGNGRGSVLFAEFASDPVDRNGLPSFGNPTGYFDVAALSGNTFQAMHVHECGLNGANFAYWYDFDTSRWTRVSNQTYQASTHCLDITIDGTTSPNLSQLITGAIFGTTGDYVAPSSIARLSVGGQTYDGSWTNQNVQVKLSAIDNIGGTGVRSMTYDAQPSGPLGETIPETIVNDAAASFTLSGEGATVVGYHATDYAGNDEAARTTIPIEIDKTPPTCTVMMTPNSIWPADHKMVPVTARVMVNDPLSGSDGFVLSSITSNEGDISTETQGFVNAQASTSGQVLADRLGTGTGRVYTLTYTARDKAGNTATCSGTISVPHDQGS